MLKCILFFLMLTQRAIASPDQVLQLENGITVSFHQSAERTSAVSMNMHVEVRAPGLSELTAQMLFKKRDYNYKLRTDLDGVHVSLRMEETQLAKVMEDLAATLQKPNFGRINEMDRLGKDADSIFQLAERRFMELAFGSYPYGTSWEERQKSIAQLTTADLTQFHRDQYCPERVRLSFSGSFDSQTLEQLIRQNFSNWKVACQPQKPAPPSTTDLPKSKRWPLPQVSDQVLLLVGRRLPFVPVPDRPLLESMVFAFGGSFTSVLNTELRLKSGLVYSTASKLDFLADGAFVYAVAVCSKSNESLVSTKLNELFTTFLKQPLQVEQLAKAKATIRGAKLFELETNAAIARFLNEQYPPLPLPEALKVQEAGWKRVNTAADVQRVRNYLEVHPSISVSWP